MEKLIRGIREFRRTRGPGTVERFAKLALGQSPDALFIACSDSRVVPNLFASTEPGDLLVVRNVGNLVAPCGPDGRSGSDESEAAALEFAVRGLRVKDIIVCGHSECAAMRSLLEPEKAFAEPHFRAWLRHGEPALKRREGAADLSPLNRLTQANVLQQLDHLRTYRVVADAEREGRVALHGWWFDIARADVHAWDAAADRFALVGEG